MHSIKIALSRYGWFTAGVLLNAFGVALITKACLLYTSDAADE